MILPGVETELDAAGIAVVLAALTAGGVLKGVTGAGAPIVAVPAIAALVDLRLAVMVMLVPNLLTNIRQAHQFRDARPGRAFLWPYLGGAMAGLLAGTWLLAGTGTRGLELTIAVAILLYVALRLLQPAWHLGEAAARRLALPAGALAGLLQGATGVSAPATMSFLNAMGLPRRGFVATVALLFCLFSALHIAALAVLGLFTPQVALLSSLALIPVLAGMEIGTRLASRIRPQVFDRLILALLVLLAVKVLAG